MRPVVIEIECQSRSLPIFPCRADKRPACPKGFYAATADADKIGEVWQRFPGPLIGVATGSISGIDVLDIDKGGAHWDHKNRDRLPLTFTYETPRGGRHLVFRHSPGLRCSASKIAPGVDVRADGGYVIWWPAAGYRVLYAAPVADWPQWILETLLAGRNSRSAGRLAASETQCAGKVGDGPLLAGAERRVPKALYLKVLGLVPLSDNITCHHQRRVLGLLRMVTQKHEHRNDTLNVAAFCFRELIGSGVVSRAAVESLLLDAATLNGYVVKDGLAATIATIRSGLGPVISGPSVFIGARCVAS